MTLSQIVTNDVDTVVAEEFTTREGRVVPTTENVKLIGDAIELEAVILYSDLANSSGFESSFKAWFTAKYFQAFLTASTHIIKHNDGEIRSFDGDRVMGVFIGNYKRSNAIKTALQINYLMKNVIKPKFERKYPTLLTLQAWHPQHCTGVDVSKVFVVRGGVRTDNDLVWIGHAPNFAAKLSAVREWPFASVISKAVYDAADAKFKIHNGLDMWEGRMYKAKAIFRSSWTWSV